MGQAQGQSSLPAAPLHPSSVAAPRHPAPSLGASGRRGSRWRGLTARALLSSWPTPGRRPTHPEGAGRTPRQLAHVLRRRGQQQGRQVSRCGSCRHRAQAGVSRLRPLPTPAPGPQPQGEALQAGASPPRRPLAEGRVRSPPTPAPLRVSGAGRCTKSQDRVDFTIHL